MRLSVAAVLLLMFVFWIEVIGQNPGTGPASAQAIEYRDKGIQAFREKKYEAAIEFFKKAAELDPEMTDAELYLGTTYANLHVPGLETADNQKNADLAVQTFQKVLRKDPTNKTALAGSASVYSFSLQFDKAREAYKKFAEADPQNHIPFYGVGTVDWNIVHNVNSRISPEEKGRLIEEGMRYLDKAFALNPEYEDTLWFENLLAREKVQLLENQIKATSDETARKKLEAERDALNVKADEWTNQALAVRKKNAEKRAPPAEIGK